jgi:hypothetical protein
MFFLTDAFRARLVDPARPGGEQRRMGDRDLADRHTLSDTTPAFQTDRISSSTWL